MYSFESRVRYSEIGEGGRLSVPAVINYMQDCSTFQSEKYGIGVAHAMETGLAWMLSGWRIEVRELPRLGEPISISTWATAFNGLSASRNFTIKSAREPEAEPLVRADSGWFLFDANKGRPTRVPESESAAYVKDAKDDSPLDMPAAPRMIKVSGEGEAAAPVTVTGALIDTNHHVNNAQYVSLAFGVLEQAPGAPFTLEVRYSRAAKLGDVIYPHVHHEELNGAPATVVTLDAEDGKPYASVRIS